MAPTKLKSSKSSKKSLAKTQFNDNLADELSLTVHFSADEIRAILHHYDALTKMGKFDRLRFREFLFSCFELTDDLMLDLIFRAYDRNADGVVDQAEFIKGLSAQMRGDMDETIEFCWTVYDMNGDGSLAREELHQCLKGCFIPGVGGIDYDEIEDAERDIVDMAMRKLDVNHDGQITFDDFQKAVKADPILVQACGPCLISPKCMARFLYTVTWDYRGYTSGLLDNTGYSPNGKKKSSGSGSSVSSGGSSGANGIPLPGTSRTPKK